MKALENKKVKELEKENINKQILKGIVENIEPGQTKRIKYYDIFEEDYFGNVTYRNGNLFEPSVNKNTIENELKEIYGDVERINRVCIFL